jgi:hypothetical protein
MRSRQRWAGAQLSALALGAWLATSVGAIAQEQLAKERAQETAAERQQPGLPLQSIPKSAQVNEVRATPASLNELAGWLAANYDLPYSAEPLRLERVSPPRLYQLRHRAFLSSQTASDNATSQPGYQREVVAAYDDKNRIVYLPENWTGETIAEQSLLVHEMVHHLQNVAGQKFTCAAEREKTAYLAQDKWLRQHGLDLEKAFNVDMFTVVVMSACMN